MKSAIAALAAMALVAFDHARAAEAPADGAKAFYRVYGSFRLSDGIPDAKTRARYAPTISPSLERLLAQADDAGTKFANAHKDSPPLIEGDLMTSNFEGATSFEVGDCATKGRLATCKVDLVYDPGARGGKPVRWTDRLVLVATDQGWRVDDIVYGATWAFGNKGRLSETLRRATADAGS
jgi:hypothetical protein